MLQFLMRSSKIFDRLDSKGVKQSIFVLSVVWVAILLGVWEFAIVLKIDSNYILPLFFDIDALNNVAVWQYFSNKIIAGDIFLTQNEISFTAQSAVLPRLSLILSALITGFFGQFVGLVAFSLLFPLLCYIYLVRIYKLFLPLRWSIMLAALGLFTMVNYPFRDFLFNIFSGDIASSLPKMTQPDIMGQPFPSLSLLVFLLLFYYSIMSTKIGASKQILMSALWGIQVYVHILNLAFGLPFWMIAMGIFGITVRFSACAIAYALSCTSESIGDPSGKGCTSSSMSFSCDFGDFRTWRRILVAAAIRSMSLLISNTAS